MAEEEVAALVVDNGSGMSKAGFAGEVAPPRSVPAFCRQAQGARHHGRQGPERQPRQCRVSTIFDVSNAFKVLVFVFLLSFETTPVVAHDQAKISGQLL